MAQTPPSKFAKLLQAAQGKPTTENNNNPVDATSDPVQKPSSLLENYFSAGKKQSNTGNFTPTPVIKPNQNPVKIGKTVDEFLPELPKTGDYSDAAYQFGGKRIGREAAATILDRAKSMEDISGFAAANDPEIMGKAEQKMAKLPDFAPKQAPVTPKPGIDKPWWEDLMDGASVGWKDMKANIAGGIADMADMAPSVFATAPAMGISSPSTGFDKFAPAYKEELAKQQRGESTQALPGLKRFSQNEHLKAKLRGEGTDQESWGYFIGSLIPQTAGIATAVGVGAFNPALGMGLGMANMGALGTMAMGAAGNEYEEYIAGKNEQLKDELGRRFPGSINEETGEINYDKVPEEARSWAKPVEFNPNDKMATMLLSYAIETGSEAIPVAKFIPKQFRGKMSKFIFGSTDVTTQTGKELLEEFARSSKSRAQLVKNLTREAGEGALVEGGSETFAEVGGELATWLYKEKEDRADWQELTKAAAMGFAGGAFMGGFIGPLSYGAQKVQNQRRRKESGKVVLAQDKTTGEALEIMGVANPSKKTEGTTVGPAMYQAIRPNGKIIEIDENNVGPIIELPLDTFNGILQGKGKAQEAEQIAKAAEAAQQAQAESDQVRAQFEPMTYQGPDGTPMISGAKYNGEDVFITQLFPDGTAVIQKPGADKQVVKQDGLTEMDTKPFEEFISTFAPPPAQTAPSVSLEPVQIGEEINMGDAKYLVTGFDEESGIVQLENNEDASDLPSLPIDQFNEFRQVAKAQQPVLAGEEAAMQADPAEESPAEQLRKLFAEGETVDLGGKTEIEEAKSLPKATEQTAKQYEDIKTLVDKKLGVKFNFATVGLQKELRLNDMKEALKQAGEIGQELADIIDFPSAALRFLNNLPDATPTRAINPQSPDLPAQQNQPDLRGAQPAITPDAPKEPVSEGVDNQVQVGEPVNNPNKLDEPTLEQQFELNPAKNTQDIDNNINEVLSQYSGKTMGKVQVFRYLTELGELGKQWAKEKGISSKEDLDKWAEKAQNKARAGKGKERKETKKLIDQQKAEFNVSEIEKMALQAENDFLNQPQSLTNDTPSEEKSGSKKALRVNGVMAFDENGNISKEFTDKIDQLKQSNDLAGLDKIYSSVRMVLNGPAQANGEKAVQAFQNLKKELEDYAQSLKKQPPTNEPVQQTEPKQQTGQEDVQAEQNQKDRPEEVQGQEELLQGGVTPSQYEDVEKASTAEELAKLYDAEVQNMEGVHPIDAAIADHIGKINPESFARFGDRNNISKGLAANWIAKKGTGKKVDLIAKDASEQFTPGNSESISTQDVIDFINKYNNISEVTTPKGNPKLKAINDKHIALTGKGLNRATALAKAKELRKQIQALQKKSVNKADDGKLLETDEQIAEYLANNPDILDFLQVSFGKPGESIWESGEINWKAALNMLETNPGFFTSFPGTFTALELDKIRTILNSKINEQAASNTTADSTVQADPKPEKPTSDAANQPNQAKQADQASPTTDVDPTGQESDPANSDNTGEAISSGSKGTGSDLTGGDVKPKTAKELNQAIQKPKENPNLAPQSQDNEQGNQVSQRSAQEELRGSDEGSVRAQAEARIRDYFRANAEELEGLSVQDRNDLEKKIIFDFAKENDLWVNEMTDLGQASGLGGQENTIFINTEEEAVYKSNNLSNAQYSVLGLLEQVKAHNEIFPENSLEVVGFTGIDNKGKTPYVEVVLKQELVENAEKATREEITAYMASLGFKPTEKTAEFTNGTYTVSDLHPRNVLKDEQGNFNVIDNIIRVDEAPAVQEKPKTAKDLTKAVAEKPAKKGKPAESTPTSKENFQDVGEKIGGAKKDTYTKQTTNLELNTLQRLIDEPLSKTIPEPDYKQLVDDGLISEEDAITLKLTRELLGRKPTKSYRIQRWAEQAKIYSDWVEKTLKGEPIVAGKSLAEVVSEGKKRNSSWEFKKWAEQIELYKMLSWITTGTTPGVYEIRGEGDQRYVVKGQYIVSGRGSDRMTFNEAAEWIAITRLKELAKERESGGKLWKFNVYQDRNTKDIFIERSGYPGIRIKQGFTTGNEAHAYIKKNYKDLVDAFNMLKDIPEDRRADNNSRIGQDHRNGRNIASAEEFMQTFGLRAVEFGNWVNAQERQDSINKAYDALMDMAMILKVPPRALGLNGELGLAFGARGSKGAAAHYESAKKVINLTKESGAGSLAHEWWHAFDNYLSRRRNEPGGFMSERPREFIANNNDPRGLGQDPTRKEIFAAFKAINGVINRKGGQWERSQLRDKYKSKKYYQTPPEMTARAFESYVIDRLAAQNTVNDYLANIAAEEDYTREEVYPYPTQAEKEDLFKGFDQLFNDIKVDESSPDMPMFMKLGQGPDKDIVSEDSDARRPKTESQTSSPAFKAWFGDSKVVNPDGSPMVVYHGSPNATFDQFKDDSHFTESAEYASIYTNTGASSSGVSKRSDAPAVYPVYLSIKKPFDTRIPKNKKLYEKFTWSYGNGTPLGDRGLPDWTDSENIKEWIEETEQDFDGIILDEGGTPEGGWRGISYVPLKPTQIKSATGNQGTFDGSNPDIRFSKPRPTTAAELNQLFSSNKAQELIEAPKGPKQTKKAGEIAAKAAEFTKGWNNAPEIITLDSPEQALARFPELAANYTAEDLGDVPAIFLNDPQTGKPVAVLIASHSYLSEKGGVERAILHEVIGHYGLREFIKQQAKGDKAIYVKAFTDLMEQVFEAKKDTALMADIAKRYFNKPVSELEGQEKLIAADEYIAHLAQSGVQDSWVDRIVTKLRQILRKLGITVGMSDAEIRALIGNSMRIVRGEKGRPVLREGIAQENAPKFMVLRNEENPDIKPVKTGQFYATKEVQQQKAKELFEELEKNGFEPSNPYTNESSFGTSTYINLVDEAGIQRKFRISDHSVTNINRILDEYHYSQNTNVKSLVESVKKDVQLSKERAERLTKQWKEESDRYKKLDEFWKTVKGNFEGLTFKRNDRTYQDLEKFSKPERSNILQRVVDPSKKAYSYEWTEQINPNELPKKKPSYDFIENLYLNQKAEPETTQFINQDQTQSPAFKAWFGDSKVVDENGKPLVVYHGTDADITTFDKSKLSESTRFGKVFSFIDSKGIAEEYSATRQGFEIDDSNTNPIVVDSYLSMKKPFDDRGPINIDSKEAKELIRILVEENGLNEGFVKNVLLGNTPKSAFPTFSKAIFDSIKDSKTPLFNGNTEKFRNIIERAGYDGIIDNYNDGVEYAVFQPTQIKSATSNNGDFNPDNADIRFMRTGATNADFSSVNTKNYGEAQLSWFERKVLETLQDRMIRSKKLIQARTGGKVSDKADFYTKENLGSGKTLEKARRFEKDLWNPLIQTANQLFNANGISPEEISDYLKFKHHAERKQYFIDEYAKQGKKIPKDDKWPTGMTDQEAADGIADFEAKADPKLVKKLRRQVHKVNQFTTFQRYKSGMITKEVFRDLLTRYKDYVPLTDWKGMEDTNDKVYTLLMSAKGRTSEAADPLPFMFTAAQEAIMRGENNRIRRSVLEFVKENVSPKDYFIRNAYYLNTKSQDEFGNDIWIETMNKPSDAQIKAGDAMRSFNPEVHRNVQQQGELTNVLPVMVDGKKVFIEFTDKEIPSAIKNINQDKLPYILDKWRNFTRWLSSMYTQYSPEFGIRNLIRDVGFGTFNILVEQDATTAAKTMKGMRKSAATLGKFFKNNDYPKGKVGEMLQEFMEEGSMTGYTDLQTAADVFARAKKEIERADKLNLWQAGGTALVKPIEWAGKGLEIYNKMLENAMRFSYYQTLREAGLSKQQAAAKAKDLTVNFNRKGRASSVMGSLFIFFNASVQGSERLIRSFTNPRTRKKALGLGGTIMAAGLMQSLLYGLSDEEDEDGRTFYEKIPDYTRRNNIILPNFFTDDGNDFLKIPLPYGLNVFHSFGESLGQVLTGKKTIGQESLGMVSAMTNVFSPIGGIELGKDDSDGFYDALSMVLPSVIQPALDLGFNRNFAGRQIYRENFASNQYQLPDSQMYFEGVNPIIREATDFANRLTGGNEVVPGAIDINPEWIEHGIDQYLGGPAQFAKNLSSTIATGLRGENVFKDPYLRTTPFARSFADKTGTDYQARSEYYENRDNAVSAAEAYDEMLQAGLKEDADQWYKEKQELINLADEFKSYEKDIRSLTKTINELKNEDNERYNDDIQKLLEERTLYMREFNKLYGERIYKKRSNPLKDLIRGN